MPKPIYVLRGPNPGTREPEIYGQQTLEAVRRPPNRAVREAFPVSCAAPNHQLAVKAAAGLTR